MSFQILLLLIIIAIAMVLFSIEIVSADVVGLGVVLVLILTQLLPVDQAFSGFGSDAFMLILGLLIMTAAMIRTGVVDIVGRFILRRTGDNPNRLFLIIIVTAAILSAFISNTAATAFFVPIVLGLSKRLKVSPSKLLMPLAFASILTSPVTLISSSSNIVVSGLMTRYQMKPIGLFELALVGIPITIAGLLYMYFIGRRLIPVRAPEEEESDQGSKLPYSTEIVVLPGSSLIGKTPDEMEPDDEMEMRVIRFGDSAQTLRSPAQNNHPIEEGDVLLVEAKRDELLKIKDAVGIDFKSPPPPTGAEPETPEPTMVEAILLPGSPLIGQTLKRLRFRERYGVRVLGIHRSRRTIEQKLSQTRLRVGDQLILQGEPAKIDLLGRNGNFRLISGLDEVLPNRPRAPWAVGIFAFSLLIGTINLVSLPVAALIGAFLMMVTRTISPEEAYREVEWKALILIGSMLAIGQAMETTGTAQYLAGHIVSWIGQSQPWVLLSVFFALTMLLTQPMSNQAAAVVVVPIAIQTAMQLSLNPRTFAIMIAVAASVSYLTPLEPSCMIVYGPGRYKFFDFLRVGLLLTIIIFVISILLVPIFWPVH